MYVNRGNSTRNCIVGWLVVLQEREIHDQISYVKCLLRGMPEELPLPSSSCTIFKTKNYIYVVKWYISTSRLLGFFKWYQFLNTEMIPIVPP